jgi:Inhibitor of growth proteins N-terminal histone-binding
MTTALYLEHYLDSKAANKLPTPWIECNFFTFAGLEHLPIELQRNFTLLRDLDTRAQKLMKKIDELATEYLEGIAYPTKSSSGSIKREELMSTIQQLFNKAKEYGDDKVQLAIQTYELVSATSMTLFSLHLMLSCNSVA